MSVDDDFVFTPELDLNRVIAFLRCNPEVDIVGGLVINLPLWHAPVYTTARLFAYRGEPVRPAGTVIDGLPVLHKVPQFFIARTEGLRLVQWVPELSARLRRGHGLPQQEVVVTGSRWVSNGVPHAAGETEEAVGGAVVGHVARPARRATAGERRPLLDPPNVLWLP